MKLPLGLLALLLAAHAFGGPPIESELVLVTPVGKSLSDPALAEFRKQAKRRWNVDVRTSALSEEINARFRREIESVADELKRKYRRATPRPRARAPRRTWRRRGARASARRAPRSRRAARWR